LLEKRETEGIKDAAIIRIEQLDPFPEVRLQEIISGMINLATAVWCQKIPHIQGAWYCSQHHMRRVMLEHNPKLYLQYAGRDAAAAPAAGSMSLHVEQQQRLVNEAFEI